MWARPTRHRYLEMSTTRRRAPGSSVPLRGQRRRAHTLQCTTAACVPVDTARRATTISGVEVATRKLWGTWRSFRRGGRRPPGPPARRVVPSAALPPRFPRAVPARAFHAKARRRAARRAAGRGSPLKAARWATPRRARRRRSLYSLATTRAAMLGHEGAARRLATARIQLPECEIGARPLLAARGRSPDAAGIASSAGTRTI